MNITKDGIVCYSREDIAAAQTYIINVLKRHTTIKLAAPFQPWVGAAVQIDAAFVTIDGSGIEIDVSKIPENLAPTLAEGANPTGSYSVFFFHNTLLDKNLSTGARVVIKDVRMIGPGANRDLVCFKYRSANTNPSPGTRPDTAMGDLVTYNTVSTEFAVGDWYSTNSYIIHHYERSIFRSAIGVYAPSTDGGSTVVNSGEGLHYYGGNISNGVGTAVVTGNPNADLRFFGTSIDYLGKVCFVAAGKVDFINCHIEQCNAPFGTTSGSRLLSVPFEVANHAGARLLVQGGFMGCYVEYQDIDAWVSVGQQGQATFRDVAVNNIRPATPDPANPTNPGNATINPFKSGTGRFIHDNVMTPYYNGNGNDTVSKYLSAAENKVLDPAFDDANLSEWYAIPVGSAVTSTDRLNTTSLALTRNATEGAGSPGSLSIAKIGGNANTNSSEAVALFPVKTGSDHSFTLMFKTISTWTSAANLRLRIDYVRWDGDKDSKGIPVFKKRQTNSGFTRQLPLQSYPPSSGWNRTFTTSQHNSIPEWVTHMMFVIDVGGITAGTLVIDDLQVYEF